MHVLGLESEVLVQEVAGICHEEEQMKGSVHSLIFSVPYQEFCAGSGSGSHRNCAVLKYLWCNDPVASACHRPSLECHSMWISQFGFIQRESGLCM